MLISHCSLSILYLKPCFPVMKEKVVERSVMDLNQPLEFCTPASSPPAEQLHNFMPMPPLALARDHQTSQEDSDYQLMQLLRQNMNLFWNQRKVEIQNVTEFKSQHLLPLARVKRIMKTDEDVKMVSADTPILFVKACEIFILEITLRAWLRTEDNQRRTLQRCDIARAVKHAESFGFLVDVVKEEETCLEAEACPAVQLHPVPNLNE